MKEMSELFDRMHARFPKLEGGIGSSGAIDAETQAGLRALGYIR